MIVYKCSGAYDQKNVAQSFGGVVLSRGGGGRERVVRFRGKGQTYIIYKLLSYEKVSGWLIVIGVVKSGSTRES